MVVYVYVRVPGSLTAPFAAWMVVIAWNWVNPAGAISTGQAQIEWHTFLSTQLCTDMQDTDHKLRKFCLLDLCTGVLVGHGCFVTQLGLWIPFQGALHSIGQNLQIHNFSYRRERRPCNQGTIPTLDIDDQCKATGEIGKLVGQNVLVAHSEGLRKIHWLQHWEADHRERSFRIFPSQVKTRKVVLLFCFQSLS